MCEKKEMARIIKGRQLNTRAAEPKLAMRLRFLMLNAAKIRPSRHPNTSAKTIWIISENAIKAPAALYSGVSEFQNSA